MNASPLSCFCNMKNISYFEHIMKAFPRQYFDSLVQQFQADKYSKGFTCWHQLVFMLYAQLAAVPSLRSLEASFNFHTSHHPRLGCPPVRRSTLSDANARRSCDIFFQVATHLMSFVSRRIRKNYTHALYLIDSTSFTLKGRYFDSWTRLSRNGFTQGIKLHLLYNANVSSPVDCSFTHANVNDLTEGMKLNLEEYATYVFDKGYCDYNWWASFESKNARFVTRFKDNVSLSVIESRIIPDDDKAVILSDEMVKFKNTHPRGGKRNWYVRPLRRVTVAREGNPVPLIFATNDMESPAIEIAMLYKSRWEIELFFKWIKQHLKIKQYLGRSYNAVRIQILTSLIAYLLLSIYRQKSQPQKSLWILLSEVRGALFHPVSFDGGLARKRRRKTNLLIDKQLVFHF